MQSLYNNDMFRHLIDSVALSYEISMEMDFIDKIRLFDVEDVYVIFSNLYFDTMNVWISLGFRPDLNKNIRQDEKFLGGIGKLPDEIIDLIATFIPKNNIPFVKEITSSEGIYSRCLYCGNYHSYTYRRLNNRLYGLAYVFVDFDGDAVNTYRRDISDINIRYERSRPIYMGYDRVRPRTYPRTYMKTRLATHTISAPYPRRFQCRSNRLRERMSNRRNSRNLPRRHR